MLHLHFLGVPIPSHLEQKNNADYFGPRPLVYVRRCHTQNERRTTVAHLQRRLVLALVEASRSAHVAAGEVEDVALSVKAEMKWLGGGTGTEGGRKRD